MTGAPVCQTCGDVAIPMRVVQTGEDGLADCVDDHGRHSQVELALAATGSAPGSSVLRRRGRIVGAQMVDEQISKKVVDSFLDELEAALPAKVNEEA